MSLWTEVKAVLDRIPDDWAVFADVFERHGLNGTVQTDRPPTISAYLPPGAEVKLGPLREELLKQGAVDVVTAEVEETDWAEAWKQFFQPRRVGKHFVVRPTWQEFEAGPEDHVMVLDPGQAFGTGDHPTTRMCLELLEVVDCAGKEVADVGCGSGILSVGALLLGAASVVAIDVDPISVSSTLENAERNGVKLEAFVGEGFNPIVEDAAHPLTHEKIGYGLAWTTNGRYEQAMSKGRPETGERPGMYDIVLSNIISAAIIGLAPEAAERVRPGGRWVVSGIIEANWPDVLERAQSCGFLLVEKRTEAEWVAAIFAR